MANTNAAGRRTRFAAEHPDIFLLDAAGPEALQAYMRGRGWIAPDAAVQGVARAGDGNMNLVLRIATSTGRLIVKQGRPWVEKYAHIDAPWGRTLVEGLFYRVVSRVPEVAAAMPALVGLDDESHVLALEDLAGARDLTPLYDGDPLEEAGRRTLVGWLRALHELETGPAERAVFANREMRALNHEHMFRFPLDGDHGLDLDAITPGLAEDAGRLRRDLPYVDAVAALGRRYLADGPALLHGDYFPGSWLKTDAGLRVIDPEFAFMGPPEFDVGIMSAHLLFAGAGEKIVDDLVVEYGVTLDARLVRGFAGAELMRRLIGVAQLPLATGRDGKRRLLELSRRLVLES